MQVTNLLNYCSLSHRLKRAWGDNQVPIYALTTDNRNNDTGYKNIYKNV